MINQDLCQYDHIPESCQVKPKNIPHTDPIEHGKSKDALHLTSLPSSSPQHMSTNVESSLEGFGYSSEYGYNSMSLLRATQLCNDHDRSLGQSPLTDKPALQSEEHRKYVELVRRLPPKAIVDTLIQTYFTLMNWQYDLLNDEIFQEQLEAWRRVSYSSLREDLAAIAPETLTFPALLFQVLAQALLVHSPQDPAINDLMVMADMTLHDRATEYSNTSADILVILGKGAITTTTVQAGLLRASFLKNSGNVVDAWHVLGATIRDAQEIGLHTGQNERRHHLSSTDVKAFSKVVGQKIWVVLHIWDAHMAVVLGRPMVTNLHLESFAHTIEDDERRRDIFAHWQTELESPRPFDVIIAGYTVAYQYFKDIHDFEYHNAKSLDYFKVEELHARITSNLELLPSWCRLENPNMRFDHALECQWLPAARQGLYSLIHLVVLTLHRPHVFSKANSRAEALKAGKSILNAQERLFQQSKPHERNLFTPVYASFDAIVLIMAICLTFPNENHERQTICIEAVKTGIQRLDIIGRCNRMARVAHGVALSLYDRLIYRLNVCERVNDAEDSERTSADSHKDSYKLALSEFSFEDIQPPRPVHDLFYDHLSSTQVSIPDTPPSGIFLDSPLEEFTDNWGFEGGFTDTSFWGVLNEFHSST